MGLTSEAEVLGFKNHDYVKELFQDCGACNYFVNRHAVASFALWLLTEIEEARYHGDAVIDFLDHDETSMRTADNPKNATGTRRYGVRKRPAAAGGGIASASANVSPSNQGYKQVITKIFQGDYLVAFLAHRVGTTDFVCYICELAIPLQRTQTGNHRQLFVAATYATHIPYVQVLADRMDCRLSCGNSDRGAPDLKMDRMFQMFFPSVPRLCGIGCVSHCVNSGQKAQMSILDATLSGVVAFHLSMRPHGAWTKFCDNCVDILVESAQPRYDDTPPPSIESPVVLNTSSVLDLCVPWRRDSIPGQARRIRLAHCLRSCDLSRTKFNLHIPGPKLEPEAEKSYVRTWARRVVDDICHKCFTPLQRARWVTNLERILQLALLALCFDLLGRACARSFPDRKRKHIQGPWDSSDEDEEKKGSQRKGTAAEKGSASYWAERNEAARGDTWKWLRNPFYMGFLVLGAIAMRPQVSLMQKVVHHGSEAWEHEQMQTMINGGERSWRLLDVHEGRLTEHFYTDCYDLLQDPKRWAALPHKCRTYMHRSMAYALVSRSVGAIWFFVDMASAGYPHKLFRLLKRDGSTFTTDLAEIYNDPDCLLDEFTRRFRAIYNTKEKLGSAQCQAVLASIALLMYICVSRIECRHAAIRRLLLSRGSTWLRDLSNVSADWVSMRCRLIELVGKSLQMRDRPALEVQETAQNRGWSHAGPWRAFVHKELSGADPMIGNGAMTAAAARYQRIKEAAGSEWAELVELGQRGTVWGRAGHHPFGKEPRQRPAVVGPAVDIASMIRDSDGAGPEAGIDDMDDDDLQLVLPTSEPPQLETSAMRAEIAAATASAQAHQKQHRSAEVEAEQLVDDWLATNVTPAAMEGKVPVNEFDKAKVRPKVWPSHKLREGSIQFIKWVPPISEFTAKLVVASPPELKESIHSGWKALHATRTDDAALKYTSLVGNCDTLPSVKLCYVAGFCVCGLPMVRAIVQRLQSWLRRTCCKGSMHRRILNRNMLAVKLFSADQCYWWHISFQNLTTWCAAILTLTEDRDPASIASVGGLDYVIPMRVHRRRTFGAKNWWQMFKDWDFSMLWSASLWQLDSNHRVEILGPMDATYQRLESIDEVVFDLWPGLSWFDSLVRRKRAVQDRGGAYGRPARRPRQVVADAPPADGVHHVDPVLLALPLEDDVDGVGIDCGDDVAPEVDPEIMIADPSGHEDDVALSVLADDVADDADGSNSEEGSDAGSDVSALGPDMLLPPGGDGGPGIRGPGPHGVGGLGIADPGPSDPAVPAPPREIFTDRSGWTHLPCGTGSIAYKEGTKQLNAHCLCDAHQEYVNPTSGRREKCRLHKNGWRGRSRLGNGRPLGLLVLWLDEGSSCLAKPGHDVLKRSLAGPEAWGARMLARTWLKSQDWAAPLFAEERDQADDEDFSEPEALN